MEKRAEHPDRSRIKRCESIAAGYGIDAMLPAGVVDTMEEFDGAGWKRLTVRFTAQTL